MKILIACEFSGIVREAFKAKGHDAWSCDLLPSEIKGQHIQGDVLEVLKREKFDLGIFHPPCTYLTVTANKWLKDQPARKSGALVGAERRAAREEAISFFMKLTNANIPKIAIENPVGCISSLWRKPDQIIQPYQYGHTDRKSTCLWLKNLPKLKPTNIVEPNIKRNRNGKTVSVHHDEALRLPAEERWKVRSRTYGNIAKAMADQWS